jgi:hypothetical protein
MTPRTKNRRHLLKATFGTSAIVTSVIACGSSHPVSGFYYTPVDGGPDAQQVDDCNNTGLCGTVAQPPDAEPPGLVANVPDASADSGDAALCAQGCGKVANPPDGGDASPK